jgi:mannonate dehydratase
MIRNAARAGIFQVKYNFTIIGIPRTGTAPGRGGARYSEFIHANAAPAEPTIAGKVDAETYWERITYFLERVVPVAEEYKVRMGCHPQDPGVPRGTGWRGVDAVLGSVEGLKRFVAIKESPYHGLNFCQGTVSEQLEKPGEQIFDVIRYFGSRKKIFSVHFRNIAGGFLNFRETFIDDGDVDMLKAMRVYKEVGYDGMMMPDHVPSIDGDTGGLQAFAFTFGYIKALIAAVSVES